MMDIYLDFNVYLSILKKEINKEVDYTYLLAKLRDLRRRRKDIRFPYSPAHMEEIAVNLSKDCDTEALVTKRLETIKFYSQSYEYLPGLPSSEEIRKSLSMLPLTPDLAQTRQQLEALLQAYTDGSIIEQNATIKTIENPFDCFSRVIADLKATDFAHDNDVFHLGRRNEKSLTANFETIQKDSSGIESFERYQKKHRLGPRRLSSVEPSLLFNLDNVQTALHEHLKNNDIDNLHTGSDLLCNHHMLEETITVILNFLEKIGYNQEENNSIVKLRSRMHDVTHAIYGSQADYFVTNDRRFRMKLDATYKYLDIPCSVISPDDFVSNMFERRGTIILNKAFKSDS